MPLNPQQQAFRKAYCNPKSPTFANALQSGLAAGFSQEYSENITSLNPQWLSEMLGDEEMLADAENALREAMNYDVKNGGKKVDVGVAGIKLKAATFTSETLGKERYSKRQEMTGADGKDLQITVVNYADATPKPDAE